MSGPNRLRIGTLLYYAWPGFALAMPTIPVYVYLPTFYAETLGLGLTTTGATLLAARLFDVVTDPAVGIASDRLRLPWGRRKPWVVVGSLIAALSMIALFQPPEPVSPAYLLAWAVALYLGWTLVAVPYAAWGAELSPDYHERARVTGAREAAMILGVLAAGAVPALAVARGIEEAESLAIVAWLAVAVGTPAVTLLVWRVGEPRAAPADRPRVRPDGNELLTLARNRPFVRLLSGWFVNGLANGLPAVLFPLYLQHALAADALQRGLLIFSYFLAGVVAIPVWLRLSRRFGKHRVWCGAMLLACLAFVWVPLLGPGEVLPFVVICICTGMALGADLALPPAMQADVVDLDTLRTRRARAGLFFALWSMATKLALACAVGIAFPVLDLFGFETGGTNGASAILALTLLYALVPVALKLIAVALIWHHPITHRRHEIIRRRLAARLLRQSSTRL